MAKHSWHAVISFTSCCTSRYFMSRITRKLAGEKYWIKIDEETRKDLQSWHRFLVNELVKPFRMLDLLEEPSRFLFTDASGSRGFAAWMGRRWTYREWPYCWWTSQSIMLLELYPTWLALRLWGIEVGAHV